MIEREGWLLRKGCMNVFGMVGMIGINFKVGGLRFGILRFRIKISGWVWRRFDGL